MKGLKGMMNKEVWKLGIMALVLFSPQIAMAAPWDDTADQVLAIFTGGLTRTLAVIAIIVSGILAMFGKMQWSWVVNIVIGIVLIFGGAAIVDYVIAAAS